MIQELQIDPLLIVYLPINKVLNYIIIIIVNYNQLPIGFPLKESISSGVLYNFRFIQISNPFGRGIRRSSYMTAQNLRNSFTSTSVGGFKRRVMDSFG